MRVLNVIMDDNIGGPQVRALSVGKELRKYGIETIFLCPNGSGNFPRAANDESFIVHTIPMKSPKFFKGPTSIIKNISWIFSILISARYIKNIIEIEEIDIVHANGLLNLPASLAANLAGCRLIWHLLGSLYPKILVNFMRPVFMFLSDDIIVISKKLGYYYLGREICPEDKNISIIYEGIDIDRFNTALFSMNDRNELRSLFNIRHDEIVIGCVGNVNPVKGYTYLIESANILKRKKVNIKFLIIGIIPISQNSYFSRLKDLIQSFKLDDCIIFIGERRDIPQILNMIDIFVLPSLSEGTPLAILEAMAMGKPVIATDVGGVSEQVLNGITGIIIPPRNSEAIADSIIYLLNHQDDMKNMGINGCKRARCEFTVLHCAQRHRDIYEKCLKEKPRLIHKLLKDRSKDLPNKRF